MPRDAKGLTIAAEAERTLGFQCLPRFTVELDRVEVAASARLGGEQGHRRRAAGEQRARRVARRSRSASRAA